MSITRRHGARRLLDEAIRLWLDAHDRLAVHALTMSAFRVLHDLNKHQEPALFSFLQGILSEVGCSRVYKLWNMLKHADRDPDGLLDEPNDQDNEWRIGIALVMYRALERDLSPEMGAFHLMSLSAYPDNFSVAADDDPDIEAGAQFGAEQLRSSVEDRRLFMRTLLNLINDGTIPANVSLRRRSQK